MKFSSIVTPTRPDQPPVANAGPWKVIQSPQDEVYLYGDDSRDDIVRVPWIFLPSLFHYVLPSLCNSFSPSLSSLHFSHLPSSPCPPFLFLASFPLSPFLSL